MENMLYFTINIVTWHLKKKQLPEVIFRRWGDYDGETWLKCSVAIFPRYVGCSPKTTYGFIRLMVYCFLLLNQCWERPTQGELECWKMMQALKMNSVYFNYSGWGVKLPQRRPNQLWPNNLLQVKTKRHYGLRTLAKKFWQLESIIINLQNTSILS